jgi:hypothetical protein
MFTSLAQHLLKNLSASLKASVIRVTWTKLKVIPIGGAVVVAVQEQKTGLMVLVAVPVLRFQKNALKLLHLKTLSLLNTKVALVMQDHRAKDQLC